MASLQIGGTIYEIAPFRLRELRRAAPYIDRIAERARAGSLDSVQGVAEAAADMLAALAVGIEGGDPAVLEAQVALTDLEGLRVAFDTVLEEAGLKRLGEIRGAPTTPAPTRAATAASPPS